MDILITIFIYTKFSYIVVSPIPNIRISISTGCPNRSVTASRITIFNHILTIIGRNNAVSDEFVPLRSFKTTTNISIVVVIMSYTCLHRRIRPLSLATIYSLSSPLRIVTNMILRTITVLSAINFNLGNQPAVKTYGSPVPVPPVVDDIRPHHDRG